MWKEKVSSFKQISQLVVFILKRVEFMLSFTYLFIFKDQILD